MAAPQAFGEDLPLVCSAVLAGVSISQGLDTPLLFMSAAFLPTCQDLPSVSPSG